MMKKLFITALVIMLGLVTTNANEGGRKEMIAKDANICDISYDDSNALFSVQKICIDGNVIAIIEVVTDTDKSKTAGANLNKPCRCVKVTEPGERPFIVGRELKK